MRLDKERLWMAVVIFVFLATVSIPYLVVQPLNAELRFGGFLVNPIDGHSYLAKMRQGYEGSWTFTLPYTAEPGAGTALNLYYLFLGHLARALGLSLLFVFHTARILGALLLALALQRLFYRVFPTPNQRLAALVLALFGSGLGWVAFAFGAFTGDFWVAEAFPFLASFTNAHFPVGMALQVWLLTPRRSASKASLLVYATGGVLLSLIYPFGWATTVAVMLGWAACLALGREQWTGSATRAAAVVVGGAPYAAYALFISNNHPMLAQWNAQNQTPSLLPLDLLISLSPAIMLAAAAVFVLWRQSASIRLLGVWLFIGVLVLYMPVNLQRRLISGLYIPAAGLAVWLIANNLANMKWRKFAFLALLALSLPTNVLIVFSGLQAVHNGDGALIVSRAELYAYAWLDQQTDGALVLASPASGLRLPAYSSARVVYGHPFETVDATRREQTVLAFFEGEDNAVLAAADFVFYGPREHSIGALGVPQGWIVAYERGGVQIWSRDVE